MSRSTHTEHKGGVEEEINKTTNVSDENCGADVSLVVPYDIES